MSSTLSQNTSNNNNILDKTQSKKDQNEPIDLGRSAQKQDSYINIKPIVFKDRKKLQKDVSLSSETKNSIPNLSSDQNEKLNDQILLKLLDDQKADKLKSETSANSNKGTSNKIEQSTEPVEEIQSDTNAADSVSMKDIEKIEELIKMVQSMEDQGHQVKNSAEEIQEEPKSNTDNNSIESKYRDLKIENKEYAQFYKNIISSIYPDAKEENIDNKKAEQIYTLVSKLFPAKSDIKMDEIISKIPESGIHDLCRSKISYAAIASSISVMIMSIILLYIVYVHGGITNALSPKISEPAPVYKKKGKV